MTVEEGPLLGQGSRAHCVSGQDASSLSTCPAELRDSAGRRLLLCEDLILGIIVALLALVFMPGLEEPFALPKLLVLRSAGLALLFLWALRTHRPGLSLPLAPRLTLTAGGFILWALLCTWLAVHRQTAFDGNPTRYNGFWTYLIYIGIATTLASTPLDDVRRRRVVRVLVLALLPTALYAIAQWAGWDALVWRTVEQRPGSSIGHPVPLGTAMGIASLLAIGLAIGAERAVDRYAGALTAAVFAIALFCTLSRGPMLGYLGGLAVFAGLLIRSRRAESKAPAQRKTWAGVALAVAIVVLLALSLMAPATGERASSLGDRLRGTEEIRLRLLLFSTAARMVAERPIFGAGFENFQILYPRYSGGEHHEIAPNVLPSMVHNEGLQLAVELGLPGLVLFLALLAACLRAGSGSTTGARGPPTSASRSVIEASWLAAIALYGIHSMTGWTHFGATPLLWMLLGLYASSRAGLDRTRVTGATSESPPVDQQAHRRRPLALLRPAAQVAFLLLGSWLVYDAAVRLHAYLSLPQSSNTGVNRQDAAPPLPVPLRRDAGYARALGKRYFALHLGGRGVGPLVEAQRQLARAAVLNPHDPYLLIDRLRIEQRALALGLDAASRDRGLAIESQLLELDPENPSVQLSVTAFRVQTGRLDLARELFSVAARARGLDSKYLLAYADLFVRSGDCATAIDPLRQAAAALRRIDPPRSRQAQLDLADCLALEGRNDAARSQLTLLLGELEGDPEWRARVAHRLGKLDLLEAERRNALNVP